ncbi:MAG: methyltransferase domain-containing protein [Pseudomonadota bacterium]
MKESTKRVLRNLKQTMRACLTHCRYSLWQGDALGRHCRGKRELLLNVGCGDLIQPHWINIDMEPLPGAFYFNAFDPLPLEDGSVAHIHMEHFLEHLEYGDAENFMRECARVLQPSGTLRLIVPDAGRYMRAYAEDDSEFFGKLIHLGGTDLPLPTPAAICDKAYHMDGDHKFGWDQVTLQLVAQQAGFSGFTPSRRNDPATPHCIDGQDWWREVESLYVDLTK